MPPSKKRKLAREKIELECGFSECTDKCYGVEDLIAHVSLHVTLMKEQLINSLKVGNDENLDNEDDDDVDRTKCECPWRGCQAILGIKDNWEYCVRHLNYHSYHTYVKVVGDDELNNRKLEIPCTRDQSLRNSVPDLSTSLTCNWNNCEYRSDNPWFFYRHVEGHAIDFEGTKKLRKCCWGSCEYSTTANGTVTKMKDHLRIHTQEKKYACSNCGVMFSQSTRLADHVTRQLVGEQTFQCSHCSKNFAVVRLLRDHLRKHVNMYGCMFCDMSCISPSALRVHILYRHSTARPYSCSQCDQTFKTKFDRATHSLTHEFKGKKFVCSVEHCGFNCKNIAYLQRHTQETHNDDNRIFGCHICDEVFNKNGTNLSKHLQTEHNLKYPSGHVKFRFAPEADGIRRLVTVRYECLQEELEEEGTEFVNELENPTNTIDDVAINNEFDVTTDIIYAGDTMSTAP